MYCLSEIKLKNTFYRTKANVAFAVTVSGEYKALFAFANQPTLIIILSLCYPPHSNPDYLFIVAATLS